ncbi:MAG: flagellar export chaperone FliS [Spirochaetales bacterium]|nr:flagellar export chaperone FliS [Spirochaetales bacterium]
MGYNQALSAYRETRVRTASQGTLIIMLYDEAIKQLGEAVSLLDDNFRKEPSRIEKISNRILKAQEIITELMASLDMEAGGEIARNLFSLYGYFNQQLVQANMDKRPEGILSVKEMMEELRLAWVEVVSNTAVPTEVQSAPAGINIAG